MWGKVHTLPLFPDTMPSPLQFEGQQVEGGEEEEARSAKRRRQTDEGAEAEGEGRPAAEGAGEAEAVQGPEVAEAVQQHHDEDSAVQALKQLSDQVGLICSRLCWCTDEYLYGRTRRRPPPSSPPPVAPLCGASTEAAVGTGRLGSHLCGLNDEHHKGYKPKLRTPLPHGSLLYSRPTPHTPLLQCCSYSYLPAPPFPTPRSCRRT